MLTCGLLNADLPLKILDEDGRRFIVGLWECVDAREALVKCLHHIHVSPKEGRGSGVKALLWHGSAPVTRLFSPPHGAQQTRDQPSTDP